MKANKREKERQREKKENERERERERERKRETNKERKPKGIYLTIFFSLRLNSSFPPCPHHTHLFPMSQYLPHYYFPSE